MKIIFVGLHNKPGKKPLCSSTKSGKLVDRIIKEGLEWRPWIKTNLYDVDYFPVSETEQEELSYDWWSRIHAKRDDIIVLLGAEVHKGFTVMAGHKIVKVAHPASRWSKKDMDAYVTNTIQLIRQKIPFYA